MCTATEAALGAPSADPSYRWLAPTITPVVVGGASNVVTVANTLTRDTGTITVGKQLSGDTAGYIGAGAAFTVRYECAVAGQPAHRCRCRTRSPSPPVALPRSPACRSVGRATSPRTARPRRCWPTAPSPGALPRSTTPTVTLTAGMPEASVMVTNPIHRVFGTLQVVKTVVDGFGAVLPRRQFAGAYSLHLRH